MANKRVAVLIFLIGLLTPLPSHGAENENSHQTAFINKGNVFLSFNGKTEQLTNSGLDLEPVLSPDGQWVAFSRLLPDKIKECKDEKNDFCANDQLWIFDLAHKSERLLVAPVEEPPDKMIVRFTWKTFSPNSQTIFFVTNKWLFNADIHAVDVDGKNERYVSYGDSMRIIKSVGMEEMQHLAGNLVVTRHKHFFDNGAPGGSYDWFWVVTSEGKTLFPIGPSIKYFTLILKIKYMEDGSSSETELK
jgi:hypothetical protein